MDKEIEDILLDVDAIKESNDIHEVNFLKQRIQIACQALKGMDAEYDQGPWSVWQDEDVVGLESNEFKHDVTFRINGDFYNTDAKLTYARKLADQLNRNPEQKFEYTTQDSKERTAYDEEQMDHIIQMYTRNRNVTWVLEYSNNSGIGTGVDLVFSDGKRYNITNYDIW